MMQLPLMKHRSNSVYRTSSLGLCSPFWGSDASTWIIKCSGTSESSHTGQDLSIFHSLPSCTTFTFYTVFFLGKVLDLGLFSRGRESSGRLLQGCRWIWSVWNMKQNKWCQATTEASCTHTCMMHFFSILVWEGFAWIINESEWKLKRDFFSLSLSLLPVHLVTTRLTQIYSGETHQTGREETIFWVSIYCNRISCFGT